MSRTDRWILVSVTSLTLLVAGCGQTAQAEVPADEGLAQIEDIAGSDVKKITMTEDAVERIGVETTPVATAAGGRVVVPTATVLYDQDGRTWVFTEPEHDVFIRAPISIVGTNGDDTILSSGPAVDTPVVTVGVAELYGTELGVGDPE